MSVRAICHLSFVIFIAATSAFSQNIPLGTWRLHNSFNSIHSFTFGAGTTYAASESGVLVFNASDNSLSSITKLHGLSGAGITSLAFDQPRGQLLVSYDDGTVDIVREKEIVRFTGLKNSTTIPGSKRINHITIYQNLAYLSADFGVVVFDLVLLQVNETWRDLGPAGESLSIQESAFLQDSIFLATASGVIAGSINSNLLDFANWKRFNQGSFSGAVKSIASFNGEVHTVIDGQGWFVYDAGNWQLVDFAGQTFGRLGTGSKLFIVEDQSVWTYNTTGTLTAISGSAIVQPVFATDDGGGKVWVADQRNGLVSDRSGNFQSYIPNGPTFSSTLRLTYHSGSVSAVSGGYTNNFEPAGKTELVNAFTSGVWSTSPELVGADVTDIAFSGTTTFVSTFGSGLQTVSGGTSTVYNNLNSPISTNRITALAASEDGVWVTNYGAVQSLHLLTKEGTWQSFSFPVFAAQYPTQLVVDLAGQVWMTLNPSQGGGILVFNLKNNQHVHLTDALGAGALPSRSVYSLAVDREGYVWAGTNAGVAYFPNPSNVFSGSVSSVKPIVNGRFLLRDEMVTAIAVDGGNRKWLGTQRGVWLFNAFGEEQVHNFNVQNSPLLSDRVSDMEIHPQTGEVFFATDKGIVSYRADATESDAGFGTVKIFPNPVTADFSGLVSISGLTTDALIKVTDISGRLVWQSYANGGTAIWNVRDYNGRRAATGMYLVIAVSRDASESIVGKIAVIN